MRTFTLACRRINLALGLAAAVLTPSQAVARDRPGTPNDVRVSSWGAPLLSPPELLVSFRNTASEPVGFWIEWTKNGIKMASTLQGMTTRCAERTADGHYCTAREWFIVTAHGHALVTRNDRPEGFVIADLEYDTRYCFRFTAVTADDVISEHWSAMACAQTPPAPGAPLQPPAPQITVLPGVAGRGTEGSGASPRALVEWRGSTGGNTGWYEVQTWTERSAVWRTARRQGPKEAELEATRVWPRDGELEATFALQPDAQTESGQVPTFRLCAVNVARQTCGETRRLPVRVFSDAAVNAALRSAATIGSNLGHVGIDQNARRNATGPNPPGAPVSVSSQYGAGNRAVSVGWIPPDESGDRPYLTFHVDIRPHGAEGGTWTKVATYTRQAVPSYRVQLNLPAYPADAGGWDLRVCAATALAMTCSPPQAPLPAEVAMATQSAADRGGVSSVPAASPPASSPGEAIKNMGRWKPRPP